MTQGPTALTGDQPAGGTAARGKATPAATTARASAPTRAGAGVGTRRQRPAGAAGNGSVAVKTRKKPAQAHEGAATLLSFPRGLFGFPGPLQFQVHDVPESGYMFRVLQSVGAEKLVFALVDASLFLNYVPEASPEDLAEVGLTRGDEAIWMVIANIPSTLADATVNLKAPLLINPFTKVAKQIILEANYELRQPLVSR